MPECPFCAPITAEIIAEDPAGVALLDRFPVSRGHCLIVPRRHVASFFDLTPPERVALLQLAEKAKAVLDATHRPDGYNLGINDGAAAGQTIPHVHLHLIPRYAGDHEDPRGGVRWIFAERARYWESACAPLCQGNGSKLPSPRH